MKKRFAKSVKSDILSVMVRSSSRSPKTSLCALEPAADDCCECCGDAFTDTSPSSASSVDPSICEWCYVNGYNDDCDQDE